MNDGMANAGSHAVLSTMDDAALGEIEDEDIRSLQKRDALGFNTYVESLRQALLSTSAPLAIAVQGDWGRGKTSLMRMLRASMSEDDESCVTAWFNVWLHEKDESPLLSLVRELRANLEINSKFLKRAGSATKKVLKYLAELPRVVKFSGGVGIWGLAKANLSVDLSKLPELPGPSVKDNAEAPLPEVVATALSQLQLDVGQKIIIFLDDLDRCQPDLAFGILEHLKLVFPHPGFAFVIGIANRDLETYLGFRHKKLYGIEDYDGKIYFEKIVQMIFPLPPLSNESAERFVEALAKSTREDLRAQLRQVAPIVRIAGRNNPRTMKRFTNGILVDHHLAAVAHPGRPVDTIRLDELAVSRALRENWLQEYTALLGNVDECKGVLEWLEKGQSRALRVASTLSGDTDFQEIVRSPSGKRWLGHASNHLDIERWVRPDVAAKHHADARFDVYISYRWRDVPDVKRVAAFLQEKGLSVMWDGRVQIGMNWQTVLHTGLRQSRAILFFVSEPKNNDPAVSESQSGEARLALELAAANPSFFVIPVLLRDGSEAHCPDGLRSYYWIDASGVDFADRNKLEEYFGEVVRLLRKT